MPTLAKRQLLITLENGQADFQFTGPWTGIDNTLAERLLYREYRRHIRVVRLEADGKPIPKELFSKRQFTIEEKKIETEALT